jgi:DNA-binding NarL/FixJ family response regulator
MGYCRHEMPVLFLHQEKNMNRNQQIEMVVVEDDSAFRKSVMEMFASTVDIHVAYSFGTVKEAQKMADQLNIDLFWIDINLPDGSGIELIRHIKHKKPDCLCLVCSMHDDDEYIFEALKAGANGYILKDMGIAQMLQSVYELKNGGAPMSPYIANKVIRSFQSLKQPTSGDIETLSAREKEVLHFLSKGMLYKEIGAMLDISVETVKKHLAKIYSKLHVQNRTEAVLKYIER